MSATVNIVNNFSALLLGNILSGKQGIPGGGAAFTDPMALTLAGQGITIPFALATAAAQKLWDAAVNVPATWLYLHFVADQNCYLQFITSATNFICVATAGVPFVMSAQTILCAAATTAMSGTAPSVTNIAKIYVQQNSGLTANGELTLLL